MAVSIYPLPAQGVFTTFAYFVVDDETNHALLVDPGAQPELFLRVAQEQNWRVEKILLTHGHFDHMGAADELRRAWRAPILAHRLSPMYLENPQLNLSANHGLNITLNRTIPIEDGDTITIEANPSVQLHVLHVPGHTEDSVAYVLDGAGNDPKIVFVGDTVYDGGPGLTVFPTGNATELMNSLKTKILTFPGDTNLLSGHAEPITVDYLAHRMM